MNTIESIEVINGQEVPVTIYLGNPTEHSLSQMERKAREIQEKKGKKKPEKGKHYKAKRDGKEVKANEFCNWNDTALYC